MKTRRTFFGILYCRTFSAFCIFRYCLKEKYANTRGSDHQDLFRFDSQARFGFDHSADGEQSAVGAAMRGEGSGGKIRKVGFFQIHGATGSEQPLEERIQTDARQVGENPREGNDQSRRLPWRHTGESVARSRVGDRKRPDRRSAQSAHNGIGAERSADIVAERADVGPRRAPYRQRPFGLSYPAG